VAPSAQGGGAAAPGGGGVRQSLRLHHFEAAVQTGQRIVVGLGQLGGAETTQMGYLDFVDLLLEEEVGLREGRRFGNALKLSRLPHHKTLDEFDFAFQPGGLDARKIRRPGLLQRRACSDAVRACIRVGRA
jgi:DNA replication protein DnaC